jgi:Flp pilus assembly protein TadG
MASYFRCLARVPGPMRRFADNESGSIAVFYGLLIVVLLLAIGAAVDVGRWLHARDQTVAAIDAAVLAGGRALQVNNTDKSGAVDAAKKYYTQNVTTRLPVTGDAVQFVVAPDGMGITASGNAFIKTPFLHFAGIEQLPLISTSQTEFGKSQIAVGGNGGENIEVSLMLDITGSMCNSPPSESQNPCTSGSKLDAMKLAAQDLVNIVVWQDQSKYTSKVAIIPFSDSVRLPSASLTKAWGTPAKVVKKTTGSGNSAKTYIYARTERCVVERTGTNKYTDNAPSSGNYVTPIRKDVAVITASQGTVSIDGSTSKTEGTTVTVAWKSNSGLSTSQKNALVTAANSFASCTLGAEGEVVPLTSNKDTLLDKIEDLAAKGGTAGQVGTAWAWYALAPNWNSVFSGTGASAYGTKELRKIAILMTDGEYNTEYDVSGIITSDPGAGSAANGSSAAQAKALCTGMKAKGIEVYTVGFGDGITNSAKDVLSNCATDAGKYYNAKDDEELKQAFRDIALKLSSLYISK